MPHVIFVYIKSKVMYYLKQTELTSAQKTRGERKEYYFQRKNPHNGKQTSRSSETYKTRRSAINGMKSEIKEFRFIPGSRSSIVPKIAQGYYDATALGMVGTRKPSFVYFN